MNALSINIPANFIGKLRKHLEAVQRRQDRRGAPGRSGPPDGAGPLVGDWFCQQDSCRLHERKGTEPRNPAHPLPRRCVPGIPGMRGEEQTMKTSTFNRIFENARSVNIQSNEWFNYAGFFWMQCTEKQLAKMRMLLKAQGCKTTVKNGEEWYILNSGTLIKVH